MDRAAALSLLSKLEALADPTRGGTPAECASAREKADALIEKHGLRSAPRNAASPPPPRTTPPRTRRGPSAAPREAWTFDSRTGAHSPNVRVDEYRDRFNWKIEVDL